MSARAGQMLTTAQAAQRAGVTRFALSRAAKAGKLHPIRDNRGGLLWDGAELDAWAAERGAQRAHSPTAQESAQAAQGEVEALRLRLAEAERRAAVAEALAAERAEREAWRRMAERLADRPRRRWWPWG